MANGTEEPRNAMDNPVDTMECVRLVPKAVDGVDGVYLTLNHVYIVSHTDVRRLDFWLPREQALTLLRHLERDTAPLPGAP